MRTKFTKIYDKQNIPKEIISRMVKIEKNGVIEEKEKVIDKRLPSYLFHDKYINYNNSGLICEFDSVIPSPNIEGYRNKCDFTIGLNKNNEKSIGFRYAGFTVGSVSIGEVEYNIIYLVIV